MQTKNDFVFAAIKTMHYEYIANIQKPFYKKTWVDKTYNLNTLK